MHRHSYLLLHILAALLATSLGACAGASSSNAAPSEGGSSDGASESLRSVPSAHASFYGGVTRVRAAPSRSASSGAIPLMTRKGKPVSGWPLRTGIPFPFGVLKSANDLRLESGDGSAEIESQIDTLATWPDGSVKSALVQFVADLPSAARS